MLKHAENNQLGDYIRHQREKRNLSIRGLARKAGLDSGALTRLENGQRAPAPRTLKSLAAALEVPLADLFARAGFATPYDLPTVDTYLHTRYGHLPEDVLTSMSDYCRRLIDEYGFDPAGPADHEDEYEKATDN